MSWVWLSESTGVVFGITWLVSFLWAGLARLSHDERKWREEQKAERLVRQVRKELAAKKDQESA